MSRAVIVFPFLTLDRPYRIGACEFLPLNVALRRPEGIKEEPAIRQSLMPFKNGRQPIADCVVVILDNDKASEQFDGARQVFEYAILSRPRHLIETYREHFEAIAHRLGMPVHDSIAFQDGRYVTVGRPEDMTRALPGRLRPVRVLHQWLPDSERMDGLIGQLCVPTTPQVARALRWFSRSCRWGNDSSETLIALVTAIQVLFPVAQKDSQRKYEILSDRLGSLTIKDPEQRRWVESVCRLRNRILHEGEAPAADFIHIDQEGYCVVPHEDVAREFFVEAVNAFVSGEAPTDSFQSAVFQAIKDSKFRPLLRSNKSRLEAVMRVLGAELTFESIVEAWSLASLDHQDHSLSSHDCDRYVESLSQRLREIESDSEHELEIRSLRNGLRRAMEQLKIFKMYLDNGQFICFGESPK